MILPMQQSQHYAEIDSFLKAVPETNKTLLNLCISQFSIYSPSTKALLDRYVLYYWSTNHFFKQLEGADKSYIIRDGILYYVIYTDAPPENLKVMEMVKVSFRKPKDLSFGFVLTRMFNTMGC